MAILTWAFSASAQNNEMPGAGNYDSRWFFDQGPIKIEHFQSRRDIDEADDTPLKSHMSWFINSESVTTKIGNMRFVGISTRSGMDRLKSWYLRGSNEELNLRFNQMLLNMVEYNRRQLQSKLNQGEIEYPTLFEYYGKLINTTRDNLVYETNMLADTVKLRECEQMYVDLLATTQEDTEVRIPKFEKKNWGWGIYWHAGYEKYMGDLADVVDGHFNVLGMTMESQYKKLVMDFDMYLSPGRKPNAYIGTPGGFNYYDSKLDWNWTNSRKIKRAAIDFRTGFNALDNGYLSLIPHVGIGIGFLDQETDSKNPSGYVQSSEISGVRYQAGLTANVKIRRILNSSYIKDYSEFNVFTKLSFIRTSYKSIEPSNSICLSIGLGGIEWFLK